MPPLAIDLAWKVEYGEIEREDNVIYLSKFGHKCLAKELAQLVRQLR